MDVEEWQNRLEDNFSVGEIIGGLDGNRPRCLAGITLACNALAGSALRKVGVYGHGKSRWNFRRVILVIGIVLLARA